MTHPQVPILAKILQMPFLSHTDFIASSLWPNNPSLHPPILYGLFKDWDGATPYKPDELPTLIYADMRTDSAKALVQMDQELVSIVKKLAELYPENPHLKSDFSMYHCELAHLPPTPAYRAAHAILSPLLLPPCRLGSRVSWPPCNPRR